MTQQKAKTKKKFNSETIVKLYRKENSVRIIGHHSSAISDHLIILL